MELSGAFAAQAELATVVGRAAERVDVDGKLLELHDLIKEILELGAPFTDRIHQALAAANPSDEDLRGVLLALSVIEKTLARVINGRNRYLGTEALSAYWSEDLQDNLMELCDDLEDLQETIALRVNPEFRSEIAAALEEARSDRAERSGRA